MRLSKACHWSVLLLCGGPLAAEAQPRILTPSTATAFVGDGLVGSVDPISPGEMAAIDLTGTGSLLDASDGRHICEFGGLTNPVCDYSGVVGATTDEFVAFTVRLEGGSLPLQQIGFYVEVPSGSGVKAPRWAGYVFDSDPGTVTPSSSFVFSLFNVLPNTAQGRGLSLAALGDPSPTLWLQPGEETATLLVAFPAGFVDDVIGGASYGVFFGEAGDQTPNVQPVFLAPEPSTRLASFATAVSFILLARRRTRTRRGDPSTRRGDAA